MSEGQELPEPTLHGGEVSQNTHITNSDSNNSIKQFLAHVAFGGVASSLAITASIPVQRFSPSFVAELINSGANIWGGFPSLRAYPGIALELALRDELRSIFIPKTTEKEMSTAQKLFVNSAIGGGLGAFSCVTRHPFSYVRQQMLIQELSLMHPAQESINRFELVKKLGLRGLYSSFATFSLFSAFVYSGLYYGTYDTMKSSIGDPDTHSFATNLVCGLTASSVAVLASAPLVRYADGLSTPIGIARGLKTIYTGSMSKAILSSSYRSGYTVVLLSSGAVMLPLYDQMKHVFIEDKMEKKKNDISTAAMDLSLACAAAGISKFFTSPLERVVLLQQYAKNYSPNPTHMSLSSILFQSLRSEGIESLWRGYTMNAARYIPVQALNVGTRDILQRTVFISSKKEDFIGKRLALNMTAGAVAGVIALILTHPVDMARVQIANEMQQSLKQKGKRPNPPPTTFDTVVKIAKSQGVRGWYANFVPTIAGVAVYRAMYFGLYDTAKPEFSLFNLPAICALAYGSTLISGLTVYPIDTVRRTILRFQSKKEKINAIQALRIVLKTEGVEGLFKGGTANIFRSVAGAGVLVLYDTLQYLTYKRVSN